MTSKGRVLAIDDEEPIRMLIKRVLTAQGYEVTVAQDGLQGLEMLQRKRFDVVLMDIRMDMLDGIEAITVLKSSASPTPIIIVTGYAREEDVVQCAHEAGVSHVLHKPFALSELIDAVEHTISRPEEVFV